jgi:pyruvate formate lyase activating enzyme
VTESIRGNITDIQRFSIHDGPGIRTLIFFKGCPLSCPWCCNPETQSGASEIVFYDFKCIGCKNCLRACTREAILRPGKHHVDSQRCDLCGACVDVCPSGALKIAGTPMSVEELVEVVEKDRIFYEKSGGGVTITGGEPLSQPSFLYALLDALKKQGFHTAIETSGFGDWACLENIRPKTDLFLFDLKLLDSRKHREVTGVDNAAILSNLKKLIETGSNVVVRIPVIPGYTADDGNIEEIFRFVVSLGKIKTIHLLPYHNLGRSKYRYSGREYPLPSLEPPRAQDVARLKVQAENAGLGCIIGG